ncbi:hypothetical protein [Ramlibacter sp.]|uniref:hypothetical protein n=1 Tax=Ramlibacter sp. TaxID=1917967 RepID=UPI0035AE7649
MTGKRPDSVSFPRAFYVKLGAGGQWESDSLANGVMRFGWAQRAGRIHLIAPSRTGCGVS